MANVLLVEDDGDQREVRALVLESAGHKVLTAADVASAVQLAPECDIAVLDLRLPSVADGRHLIHWLRDHHPRVPLIVLSGWAPDLRTITDTIDAALEKPVKTSVLLGHIARLAVCFLFLLAYAVPGFAAQHRFTLQQGGEAVAHLEIAGPEGAVAELGIDGRPQQNILLFAGERSHRYSVFLGHLAAGAHVLSFTGADPSSITVEPAPPYTAFAPVLFERKNAIGKFTDFPILTYAEKLREGNQDVLQYTVIFSNEDGGTSTRSLMARWGRVTDIEYVYRAYLKPDGSLDHAIIQGRDHKDLPFTGPFFGTHPMLMPVTDNNMVAGEGPSAIRYQPAPALADLSKASREQVMDENPITWRVMTRELIREKKLREFGRYEGEKISDPRNYLYLEANLTLNKGRIGFAARLANGQWYFSHTGRTRDTIERSGWVRSTIELPPGTSAADVQEFGAFCSAGDKEADTAECRVEEVSKVFFLNQESLPGPSIWRMASGPTSLLTGRMITWNLLSK